MTVIDLRKAWEALPDAVLACGADGSIMAANGAAHDLFGRSLEGEPLATLAPESLRGRYALLLARALARGVRTNHRLRVVAEGARGEPVQLEASLGPLDDGAVFVLREVPFARPEMHSGSFAVLAGRAALAEERTRLVLESVGEGILGIDPRGRCIFANPACARLLGYECPENLLGKDVRELTSSAADSFAAGRPHARHIDELCLEERPEHVAEELLGRLDGSSFWAECWSYPIRRGHERVGAVITFLDITARKKTEEEHERLRAELEEAVRARDEFLSLASHELRTPLTPLQLHVQGIQRALLRSPETMTTAELLTRLEAVARQVTRIERLIAELLDAGRLSGKPMLLEAEDLDLGAVVRDVVAGCREELARARCEVQVDAEGPVLGRWDHRRLDQVVSSLLSNAMKFGAGRRIELRVWSPPGSRAACLRVRDYGIGIAPADHRRVFERFERAVPSRHYGGFGLGLWMVSQVVHAMGGEVSVESDVGQGATFTVELPLGMAVSRQALAS